MSLGPELLIDPTFSDTATNWAVVSGSFVGIECRLTPGGGTALFAQLIPPNSNFFQEGLTYRFSFDGADPTGDNVNPSGFHLQLGVGADWLVHFESPTTSFVNYSHDYLITQQMIDEVTSDGLVFLVQAGGGEDFGEYFAIKNPSIKQNTGNLFLQTTLMVGAESGDVQTLNAGKSDDSTPIYYELNTQEIEFGNRAHLKNISDQIAVAVRDGQDSSLQCQADDNTYKDIEINLSNRVNIGKNLNLKGNYFTFKWFGQVDESSPVLEGIYLEKVEDVGIVKE